MIVSFNEIKKYMYLALLSEVEYFHMHALMSEVKS